MVALVGGVAHRGTDSVRLFFVADFGRWLLTTHGVLLTSRQPFVLVSNPNQRVANSGNSVLISHHPQQLGPLPIIICLGVFGHGALNPIASRLWGRAS
jgi:hypothetical protein